MIDSQIHINFFQPADQGPVKALILAGLVEHFGFLDPTKNPDLEDIASSYAESVFLVARLQAEIIATGALIPEKEGVGRIVRMSVAQALRRQGIGYLILRLLVQHGLRLGYQQIVLETTASWSEVIAFYERFGFRQIAQHDGEAHFVFDLAGN